MMGISMLSLNYLVSLIRVTSASSVKRPILRKPTIIIPDVKLNVRLVFKKNVMTTTSLNTLKIQNCHAKNVIESFTV